jgi:hypothetical protein
MERLDRSSESLNRSQLDLRSEPHALNSEMSALRRYLGSATAVLLAVIVGTGILT